jgi:hypothetical protein
MARRYRIPPMVPDLILTALQICDGMVFDLEGPCPDCGDGASGYDQRKRRFAVIRDNGREQAVSIYVKRFQCKSCHRIFSSNAPFYPETRAGSPVVDLCMSFAASMPYYRVSAFLNDMGIIVDRGAVRSYSLQNRNIVTAEMYGIRLPVSVILLASLTAGATGGKGCCIQDVLSACNPSGQYGNTPGTEAVYQQIK